MLIILLFGPYSVDQSRSFMWTNARSVTHQRIAIRILKTSFELLSCSFSVSSTRERKHSFHHLPCSIIDQCNSLSIISAMIRSMVLSILVVWVATIGNGWQGIVEAFLAPAIKTMPTRSSSTSSGLHMTILTYNGKKKNFPAGSPLSRACAQLGVPVKYSCKKCVRPVCYWDTVVCVCGCGIRLSVRRGQLCKQCVLGGLQRTECFCRN
jgi:hypothetical protein